MANIKLNIDVVDNVLNTLKQVNSMGETVVKTLVSVKKSVSDIKAPNFDFFSDLADGAGNLITTYDSLKKGIGEIGGKTAQATIENKGLIAGIKEVYLQFGDCVTNIDKAELANMSFLGSLGKIGGALLTNPIFLIVAAIVGIVIAIQELGKYMGWWTDWGSMIESFSAGIQRLWSSFTNNPQVIAFIEQLKGLWGELLDFISPLTSAIGDWWNSIFPPQSGEFDIVRAIIDFFGLLGEKIGWFIGVIAPFATLMFDYLVLPLRLLGSVLGPVIGFIASFYIELSKLINGDINLGEFAQKILGHLISMLEDIVSNLWNTLSGFAGSFINAFSGIGEWILSGLIGAFNYVVSSITGFLSNLLSQIVDNISNTIQAIPQKITELISNFANIGIDGLAMIIGAIFGDEAGEGFKEKATEVLDNLFNVDWWLEQFTTGITNIATMLFDIHPIKLIIDALFGEGTTADLLTSITNFLSNLDELPGKIWEFLVGVITQIGTWMLELWEKGKEAGLGFLNQIIQFIKQLPIKFWESFLRGLEKIAEFASQALNKAVEVGSNIVNGVIDYVKKLPDMVYQEFIRIGDRIMAVGGQLYNKAKKVGEGIWNSLKGALGISSPGHMYWMLHGEWERINEDMNAQANILSESASFVGDAVSTAFNPLLGMGDMSLSTQTLENPVDYSSTESGFKIMGGLITNTTGTINDALMNVGLTYAQLNSGIMEGTLGLEESNIVVSDSFYSLENSVTGALNNIADSNTSNWDNINTTTESQLNSIYSSTRNVTQQMASAWSDMKSKITAAASSIQTQSTAHFNSLSKTIGGFYNNLQNPGRWGAGPVSSSRSSGSSGGRFSNIISSLKPFLNKTIGINSATFNPCISSDCLEYTQFNKKSLLNINDLIDNDCIKCNLSPSGGAGWLDSVKTNVGKIKSLSNPWNMKGPVIANKYKTGLSFKVKDFLSGSPQIGFDSFKAIAESIFSQIRYSYYFNSEKYGNWLNAFNAGHMNCSDSSDALIALARTMGLPASKVHGHWGNVGHFWANIAGRKMDTTGFMLNKGWTPSQSRAGPAPQSSNINNIFESIYNVLNNLFGIFKSNKVNVALDTSSKELFNTRTDQILSSADVNINLGGLGGVETHIHIDNSKGDLDEEKIAKLSAQEIERSFNDSKFLNQVVKAIQERDSKILRYGGRI